MSPGDRSASSGGAVTNIVLAGVGGQGSVLATRVLALAAEAAAHPVVTSEVHGMSQRGGTVITTVRLGDDMLSPTVPRGEADYLVAFELLEAARHVDWLKEGGVAVVNEQRIRPSIEALRHADYPGSLAERAEARGIHLYSCPALDMARQVGNEKLASAVLLGVLSTHLPIVRQHWLEAIRAAVPAGTVEANESAFDAGAGLEAGART